MMRTTCSDKPHSLPCIRERNEDLDFSFENRTESFIDRLFHFSSDFTSVSLALCTFNEMTTAWTSNADPGGAAILLNTSTSLHTIRTTFFHTYTASQGVNYPNAYEGVIHVFGNPSKQRPISISDSSFTECSSAMWGGCRSKQRPISISDSSS
ncbi:hypothetical protein BLNAU_21048 [Blattamonas nauphoetae]|uniref:Uncharacterized protein n=1 Tax=Blattamonas nauphoetae TaxID=2049346 RepID=A0ABQ9WY42_9EUKA|nr:hypothetical protein BLNAU_21048 [Blattamonas nauphoetae]